MVAHGHPRGVRIVRDDGLANPLMLGVRGIPRGRIFEIMRQLGEVRIEALIEQFADDADQHGVVGIRLQRHGK